MNKFKTFEEISTTYPLDNKSNIAYYVYRYNTFCCNEADISSAKEVCPIGKYNKHLEEYTGYNISSQIWYDYYLFDGENWRLGLDGWDGIEFADIPRFGIYNGKHPFPKLFGIFKTKEEAEEYCHKKLEEEVEF